MPSLPFVLERLGFLALSVMQWQMRLQISSSEEYRQRFRIKRRGVSPSPSLGWASCSNFILQSLYIHFWWMALFFFDFIQAVLCAMSTLWLMHQKYILA